MARKVRNYKLFTPYHIVARSNNGDWFAIDRDQCWSIFSTFLYFGARAYNVRIHGFVLMSNHFHLLASYSEPNQSLFMNRFLTEVSTAINDVSGRTNHVFGGRNKPCEIGNTTYYLSALKYLFRNPVRAGLCNSPMEYKYSSLHAALGSSHGLIINDPLTDFEDLASPNFDRFLSWLNLPTSKEKDAAIKKALWRTEFSPGIDRKTRVPIDLSDDIEL